MDQASEGIEEMNTQALCHETRRGVLDLVGSDESQTPYTALANELSLSPRHRARRGIFTGILGKSCVLPVAQRVE